MNLILSSAKDIITIPIIIELMISRNPKLISVKDDDELLPIHHFLNKYYNINSTNKFSCLFNQEIISGLRLTYDCAKKINDITLQKLVDAGFDPTMKLIDYSINQRGLRLLHVNRDLRCIKFVLSYYAKHNKNIEIEDSAGWTPFCHYLSDLMTSTVSVSDYKAVVYGFLKAGADPYHLSNCNQSIFNLIEIKMKKIGNGVLPFYPMRDVQDLISHFNIMISQEKKQVIEAINF
jgi:hypothetical protein